MNGTFDSVDKTLALVMQCKAIKLNSFLVLLITGEYQQSGVRVRIREVYGKRETKEGNSSSEEKQSERPHQETHLI